MWELRGESETVLGFREARVAHLAVLGVESICCHPHKTQIIPEAGMGRVGEEKVNRASLVLISRAFLQGDSQMMPPAWKHSSVP